MSMYSDTQLVLAAQNGDSLSFEELYRRYYDKIYALAKMTVKNDADAEDVLQVTFIKAWQNLHTLENPAAFNTWLQRIALNECHSLLRKNRPVQSVDDEDEDGEMMQIESDLMLPEQYAERDDLSARLGAVIDQLSVVQRETILLYYFSEMSVEEIAETMDCSVGTVKSRLYLARRAIKTEIEAIEEKTGERFYSIAGVALVPFAGLFIRLVKSSNISAQTAASLFRGVSEAAFRAPVQQAVYADVYSDTAASGRRYASGNYARRAGTAVKHQAAHAASAAAKSTFPLWTKIAAGVLAVGLFAGGGVFAWSKLRPQDEEPALTAVTEPPAEPESSLISASEEETALQTESTQAPTASASFEELSGEYSFTPGNNWSTTMTLNSDGSFTGRFYDEHIGSSSAEYNSEVTYCAFSGTFSNLQQKDGNTYTFELSSLDYENEAGTEEIITIPSTGNKILYHYSDPMGLSMDKPQFTFYSKDSLLSDVPEELSNWRQNNFGSKSKSGTLEWDCLYQDGYPFGWRRSE